MAQLRRDYPEFARRGAEIVAIGPEDAKSFAKWWRENEMPFIGLADPGHTVAKIYGQQIKILKLGRMPALFIVDKSGTIRFVHYGNSMSDIPENSDILARLEGLGS